MTTGGWSSMAAACCAMWLNVCWWPSHVEYQWSNVCWKTSGNGYNIISGWWPSYVLNTVSIGRSYFFPCSIPFHSIQTVIDDSTPAECESEKNVIKYIETGESWCETFAKSWPTSQHKSDWIRVGSKPSSNKIWDEPNLPLCCQDQMGRKLFRWFIYVWFLVVLRLSLCGGLGWWFGGSGKFWVLIYLF